jgi:hypothetical protein
MKQNVFLILIIVLAIGLPLFFKIQKEGFSNYTLDNTYGIYPESQDKVLVQDFYPRIQRNGISNDTASKIWWHRPTFKLGSYAQITNNIRYSNNPDVGSCSPASMCGALYHENQLKTNYVKALPPVNVNGNDTRVNYYNSTSNLVLPFRTNVTNVLY